MPDIFVYAPDADDYDCLGACGPLTPTRAEHTEEANGMSELELDHPIDEHGRWGFLQRDYILKAEVPVRTCPEIAEGALVTSVETWHVKAGASKASRYLYSKPAGGKKRKLLPEGTTVFITAKSDTRYKARTGKYVGWIAVTAIEYDLVQIIADDPAAIETVIPAWTRREQLFRIYSVDVQDTGVKVKARHIFYDLLGNITTYAADAPTCGAALDGILDNCAIAHEIVGYTNMADTRVGINWTRVNPVDALLAPDTGLLARWQGELVRDDQEFYVLDDAGMNRGVRIAYGKNLLGVQCTLDLTNIATRILPVGQTSKGQPLLLAAGSYTVDGATVVIDSSLTVASAYDADYASPHIMVLDLGADAKAAGGKAAQVLAARVVMIRAALAKFADEEIDLPAVSVKVDFINLGDTVEYAQYKQLEDVYLYDNVRVYHPDLDIDLLTQVKRVVYDCLTGKFGSIELGTVRTDMVHTAIATWQLGAIPGQKIVYDTVRAAAIARAEAANLNLADNGFVWTVKVKSSKSATLIGTPEATTLTAEVYAGGEDITATLDAALFYWVRVSTDTEADAAWNALHIGMKSVTISGAERAIAAQYTAVLTDGGDD